MKESKRIRYALQKPLILRRLCIKEHEDPILIFSMMGTMFLNKHSESFDFKILYFINNV